MRIGSLFSGYGGLDLGVMEALGGTVAWHAEFEAAPARILAHHWPDVPNLGDVTAVDWSAVEPVDIICGGSPCQDVSMAGARKGMRAGTRSGLWASMCDAIETIRPALVVWENVRGALSAGADSNMEPCDLSMGCEGPVSLRALGRVLGDLAELGYDAGWEVVRASDIGAPHRRERVFVLAWPANTVRTGLQGPHDPARTPPARLGGHALAGTGGSDLTLLPTPAASVANDGEGTGTWLARRERVKLTADNGNGMGMPLTIAVQLLPTPDAYSADRGGPQHPDKRRAGGHSVTIADAVSALLPTPRATDGTKGGPNQRGSSGDLMLPSAVQLLPTPRVTQAGYANDGRGGKSLDVEARRNLLPTPRVSMQHGPSQAELDADNPKGRLETVVNFGQYAPAIARWEAVLGRAAPAPTETKPPPAPHLNRHGNPRANPTHRLSARFVEWMMGLPEGHVVDVPGITRNQALKALGNGVVPQQAAHTIRRILAGVNG